MTGVELIAAERVRGIDKEGFSSSHDDAHVDGELVAAARCYLHELAAREVRGQCVKTPPPAWPWEDRWWKPKEDAIAQLAIVGALLAAEIDRRQRAAEECDATTQKASIPKAWRYVIDELCVGTHPHERVRIFRQARAEIGPPPEDLHEELSRLLEPYRL